MAYYVDPTRHPNSTTDCPRCGTVLVLASQTGFDDDDDGYAHCVACGHTYDPLEEAIRAREAREPKPPEEQLSLEDLHVHVKPKDARGSTPDHVRRSEQRRD